MIADYSSKPKLRRFSPFRNAKVTNEDRSSTCVRIPVKIAFFVAFDTFVVGQRRDFTFGTQVGRS